MHEHYKKKLAEHSKNGSFIVKGKLMQGLKLKLANWQNASDFVNLRVRKISTSKRLLVKIIHVSQKCSREVVVVRTMTKETKHLPPFL